MNFLNTSILFGLFGIGIPILIHFFAKEKSKKILFSSLVFLKKMQPRQMKRLKVRQWLLLALRCLAIVFLVLSFARPAIRNRQVINQGGSTSLAIAVDRSLSTDRKGLYPRILSSARNILELLKPDDEAVLIWTNQSESPHPAFSYNKNNLIKELENTAVSSGRGNFSETLRQTVQLISSSQKLNREIYLISDLQGTGFQELQDSIPSISWEGPLFVSYIQSETGNTAVQQGGIRNISLKAGMPIEVFARLLNFGSEKADHLVRVYLDGRAAAQREIGIMPNEVKEISFQIIPERTGWHQGTIEIDNDVLLGDNRWYFVFKIPEKNQILLLGKNENDIQNIQQAFMAAGQIDTKVLYEVDLKRNSWIHTLDQYHSVFISNLPALKREEVVSLIHYIEKGGGLFFFPGPDVDIRNWNSLLFTTYLDMTLGNIQSSIYRDEFFTFQQIPGAHPLFKDVFESGTRQVIPPRIYKRIQIISDSYRPIISYQDGSPFLAQKSVKRGKVFVCSTSPDGSWSDLSSSSFFAPLMVRSSYFLGSPVSEVSEKAFVNNPVAQLTVFENISDQFRVENPSGESILLSPKSKGEKVLLELSETPEPGIYRFYRNTTLIGMQAVNVDPMESDLDPIASDFLQTILPDIRIIPLEERDDPVSVVSLSRFGREYWEVMLILALAVLIVEMAVSKRWIRAFRRNKKDLKLE